MSAIFDFSSLLTVILLLICTCAYLRDMRPTIFDGGQVRRLVCFALEERHGGQERMHLILL